MASNEILLCVALVGAYFLAFVSMIANILLARLIGRPTMPPGPIHPVESPSVVPLPVNPQRAEEQPLPPMDLPGGIAPSAQAELAAGVRRARGHTAGMYEPDPFINDTLPQEG